MEDKITIIEGPAPTFDHVVDVWANGIAESPTPSNIMVTRLRTFNGPALVERCHRAWRDKQAIHLEYRGMDSINREALIVAARHTDSDDGQLLILWLRLPEEEIEVEIRYDDDDDDSLDSFDLDY